MTKLRFEKYQGLGNDFIVIRCEDPEAFGIERARALCDRHFGIGADGVLLVSPARGSARARMTVLNADGSRPEMCGNGLRCVALDLGREDLARSAGQLSREFVVETDAGPRPCHLELDPSGLSGQVKTGMGRGRSEGHIEVSDRGTSYAFERFSMGNPHAIRFGEPESLECVDRVGPLVSGKLAGGSNVEFVVQNAPRELEVVVWERGVGRTLACGTGAAATAVAAAVSGRSPFDEPIMVHLPGGPLEIRVARETLEVELTGPAAWVFGGEAEAP
jgi:diaminopimelate epimerase